MSSLFEVVPVSPDIVFWMLLVSAFSGITGHKESILRASSFSIVCGLFVGMLVGLMLNEGYAWIIAGGISGGIGFIFGRGIVGPYAGLINGAASGALTCTLMSSVGVVSAPFGSWMLVSTFLILTEPITFFLYRINTPEHE